MSCIITYKGQKYSEEQFKEYFINNKQEFATSIAKNKDVMDSFKRKMEGIDFVFSQSPELASIGNKAQYLQYLSTIFKTSKVKDIVYHGTYNQFDRFEIGVDKNSKYSPNKGIFFSSNKEVADSYINMKSDDEIIFINEYIEFEDPNTEDYKYYKRRRDLQGKGKVLSVILNIKNIEENSFDGKEEQFFILNNTSADGLKLKDIGNNEEGYEYVVFEPEQIHILSSKKDLEMFRNFINFTKSEYAKYGGIQQFRDYIMSKNFAAIEEFLVVNNKIDRKC